MPAPVVAVTGATGGLGHALAGALAETGAKVVLVCRDGARGEAARREVAAAATGPAPELVVADLADLASVRGAAQEIRDHHSRLDALVNNAAVFSRTRSESVDGYELMFATNHLGPFLLTNFLLDPLRAASGRVLTLSAPSTVSLDFDDLQSERSFKALRVFGASKMANLLFTYELARRGEALGITANAIHPGLVRSHLMRDAPAPLRWATGVASRPPAKAAAAIVPVILGPEHATTTGELLKTGEPAATNDYSHDPAVQTRLWDVSCSLSALSPPSSN